MLVVGGGLRHFSGPIVMPVPVVVGETPKAPRASEDVVTQPDLGLYDPAADRWTLVQARNQPSGRFEHTFTWTGREAIVWGGLENDAGTLQATNTGARYDVETGVWTPMSLEGAPSPRFGHTAVWTGQRLIVWGGASDYDLSCYAPLTVRAPLLKDAPADEEPRCESRDDGAVYDPASDTWTPVAAKHAPIGRFGHTAIWTGSQMVVWGGRSLALDAGSVLGNYGVLDSLALYDLDADAWGDPGRSLAPVARHNHEAVWTGHEMIVWGGQLTPFPYPMYDENAATVRNGGVFYP
jgi:hypothetical protein